MGLSIPVAQVGKPRLRKAKQLAPGCTSGGGKTRTEAQIQIQAHEEGSTGLLVLKWGAQPTAWEKEVMGG